MVEIEQDSPLGEAIIERNGISEETRRSYYSRPQSEGSPFVQGYTGIEYVQDRTFIKPVAVVKVVDN